MATLDPDPEAEIRISKEKNNELVQKVQYWKMLAAQRENEKLDLMKEMNDMRLKLSRLRHNCSILSTKLQTSLQSASEVVLNHLVKASGEVANTMELTKAFIRECNQLEADSPRWSSIGGTPRKTEKVHRVPPMMIGGQSIQPVVSLSRTLLNTSNSRPAARSPTQNRNVTERAVPMHMLQDVYIPLTRIDASELLTNNTEAEEVANDSDDNADEVSLENSSERDNEESQRMSDEEDYNALRRLDAVAEDMETEHEVETPPRTSTTENPLEGPSWLLDVPSCSRKSNVLQSRHNLEPDSTTEMEEVAPSPSTPVNINVNRPNDLLQRTKACSVRVSCEFSPTVRRRKRTSSPPPATPRRASQYSPRPHNKRNSNNGRVLKVMVAKMHLESFSPGSPAAKRAATLSLLDAPSPNGATVPGVIVSESTRDEQDQDPGASGEPAPARHGSRRPSHEARRPSHEARRPNHEARRPSHEARRLSQEARHPSHEGRRGRQPSPDMDESEGSRTLERSSRKDRSRTRQDHTRQERLGSCDSREDDSASGSDDLRDARTRRPRKVVSYQEKPLNRKLRR